MSPRHSRQAAQTEQTAKAEQTAQVAPPNTEASDRIDPRVWKVAVVVFLGPFMTQLDSTVVNLSLSAIHQDLQASIATTQWVVSGYLLALALMLPMSGWLVDRVGAKRLYLACFSAFTLTSVLCGASRTIDELICARVLQGMAGGILAPMTQMMMARVAGRHMARVMGYTVTPVLIAPILGPVMAGAILKYASWPWLFFLNLPIGLLGVGLAAALLPSDASTIRKRPFDLLGFALIAPGLASFLYGLELATHRQGGAALLAGVALVGAFIWHARHKAGAALIDLRLFRGRVFGAAAMTQFWANGLAFSRQFLIPLYLISGCGLSAPEAGWTMAAMGFGMMCSFPMLGMLTEKFGCRAVSAGGSFLAMLGVLPFLWMVHGQYSPTLAAACLFITGIGQGTINIPSISAAYASVARDRLAVANTAINIVQRLGGPVAVTVMAIVMSLAQTQAHPAGADPNSFMTPFVLLIALNLLVFAAACRLPVWIHQAEAA